MKKPDLHLEELFDEDELPDELKETVLSEGEEGEGDNANEDDEALLEEEEGEEEEEGKDQITPEEEEAMKAAQAEADRLMDELYQLDYEDMIGDTPVRFHYTKVKPQGFGLSVEDIMQADDKDLRQFVSMKKLAPYRDHDWRVSKDKVGKFKAMLQKKLKREEEEEKLSRKEQKKNRKKEKKEMEKKMKEMEEMKASKKRNRKNRSKGKDKKEKK